MASNPFSTVCAETISILYLLHSVPLAPSHNLADGFLTHQNGYTLDFEREKALVSTLAFLSYTRDDPDHIPAVCVRQCPHSSSLSLLVAVNKAKPSDGAQNLQEIKSGFERLFAVLSHVADDYDPTTQRNVFSAIIAMCSRRILCRLRLTAKKRGTTKRSIKSMLQEATDAIRRLENQRLAERQLQLTATSFLARAKEVMQLIDSWTKCQTTTRLGDVVEGLSRLQQIGQFPTLLEIIPNRSMDPTSRQCLHNIIVKITRYWEAAAFLRRMAKRFPIIRRTEIVLATLPQDVFRKATTDQYSPSLPSALTYAIGPSKRIYDLADVSRLIHTNGLSLDQKFAKQARKTLKEGKIHAEIQLIYYCELEACDLSPRVVCSSKDACFLCNTFVQAYARIYTPRSHGRLYPAWRLPNHSAFTGFEQRFIEKLKIHVRQGLSRFSQSQKALHPDPYESTLLILPASGLTLQDPSETKIVLESHRTIPGSRVIADTGLPNTSSADRAATKASGSEKNSDHVIENIPLVSASKNIVKETVGGVDLEVLKFSAEQSANDQNSANDNQSARPPESDSPEANTIGDIMVQLCHSVSDGVYRPPDSIANAFVTQTVASAPSEHSVKCHGEQQNVQLELTGNQESSTHNETLWLGKSTKQKKLEYHFEVGHSRRSIKWVDMSDLQLLIEFEASATTILSVLSHPSCDASCTPPTVDVDKLGMGHELVVLTDQGQDRQSLHLMMQDKSGNQQQWKLKWEMVPKLQS